MPPGIGYDSIRLGFYLLECYFVLFCDCLPFDFVLFSAAAGFQLLLLTPLELGMLQYFMPLKLG